MKFYEEINWNLKQSFKIELQFSKAGINSFIVKLTSVKKSFEKTEKKLLTTFNKENLKTMKLKEKEDTLLKKTNK